MAKKNRWDMKAVEEVISKFGDSKPANSYLDTSGTSFNDIQSSDYIKITEI
jgi:hypothetical protein